MTKYESQIYTVNATQEHAYERMSNLMNFEALLSLLTMPYFAERVMANVPS